MLFRLACSSPSSSPYARRAVGASVVSTASYSGLPAPSPPSAVATERWFGVVATSGSDVPF